MNNSCLVVLLSALILQACATLAPIPRDCAPKPISQIERHDGRIVRDRGVIREFRRQNPCPLTGEIRGECPGYEVDHIVALKNGGLDHLCNLQWLSVEAHRFKSRHE